MTIFSKQKMRGKLKNYLLMKEEESTVCSMKKDEPKKLTVEEFNFFLKKVKGKPNPSECTARLVTFLCSFCSNLSRAVALHLHLIQNAGVNR